MPSEKSTKLLNRYLMIILLGWIVVMVISLWRNIVQINDSILENARIQARVAYDKDIIYRRWATMHGGVYVPLTDVTPSNPDLADIPERDITTPSGKQLTLMNPAYMTRQVHEIESKESGVLGHITSLNPIRSQNAADAWEVESLQGFEKGNAESSGLAMIKGKEYMRLMKPLFTEQGCLRCHAKQGYKLGDVRGGISISVPMKPLQLIGNNQMITIGWAHGLISLLGLIVIGWGARQLRRSEAKRLEAEKLILYQRNHDALTGLYNRGFFDEEMSRLEKSLQFPISIIMCDIDDLKNVNDSIGHEAGDRMIQEAAQVLKSAFRSEDVVTRLGGDEFAILLPSTDADRTQKCIQRITQTLGEYNALAAVPIRISIGSATALNKEQMLPEILRMADQKMYEDKQNRKRKNGDEVPRE